MHRIDELMEQLNRAWHEADYTKMSDIIQSELIDLLTENSRNR